MLDKAEINRRVKFLQGPGKKLPGPCLWHTGASRRMRKEDLFKIGACEFLMIHSSGIIISHGSIEFIIEIAEPKAFAVDADGGEPFSLTLTERDASVTRVCV
jgi:hypothetical protein